MAPLLSLLLVPLLRMLLLLQVPLLPLSLLLMVPLRTGAALAGAAPTASAAGALFACSSPAPFEIVLVFESVH